MVLDQVFTALLVKHHSRNTTIIAISDGLIDNLTGFAGASYQLAVRFIQVPETPLFSQVDSFYSW